jgi:Ca-activated chloride channel family protein
MKKGFLVTRIIGIRLFTVCASAVLFFSLAHGQSTSDVHISPRQGAKAFESVPDAPAVATPPASETNTLRVSVDVVLVPVTVSDADNHPVTTLKKQDFALCEEGKRQEIRYFSAEDSPLSIAILFDVSKSMRGKIDTERAALVEFFNNANPDDEYFAITFSDRPRLIANSTQSIDTLQSKLLATEPGGPTAMLDAINLAESKLRTARYERKAIVIISDGGDNASRYTLRETKSVVQESDVQIYAIGLFETFFVGTFEEKLGKKWLSEITDASGGRTITVANRNKLPEAAAQISREIRNQYILGYRPDTANGSMWRKIKVSLTVSPNDRHLHAFYRKGYFSAGKPPAQSKDAL